MEFDEFNKIKNNTLEINNDIVNFKDEIKNHNDKYLKMISDIEKQDKKYEDIKKLNDDINKKISFFINQYK